VYVPRIAFERLGDLLRNGQRLVERQRAFCDGIRERRAFREFQDERVLPESNP
jgi:hypothetical protein